MTKTRIQTLTMRRAPQFLSWPQLRPLLRAPKQLPRSLSLRRLQPSRWLLLSLRLQQAHCPRQQHPQSQQPHLPRLLFPNTVP